MIESIKFRNYRVLRDAVLPLQPFTVIVGPNGSGKSTVMHALRTLRMISVASVYPIRREVASVIGGETQEKVSLIIRWSGDRIEGVEWGVDGSTNIALSNNLREFIEGARIYALNENAIIAPVQLAPHVELREDGGNLAVVLDRLRDEDPEAFEALNEELGHLLPEFDRILFETPSAGTRAFMLRMRKGQHALRASDLSQGTILALTILTLAYLPEPPSIVCLEEPDRGIHPRLYRDIRDALYRLSYPESFGLSRDPVQVLITTHSPYLLDLHREHPEEIVIAQKTEDGATFQRLSDREDLPELLEEASLGEIWYSGILGGVPAWR